MDDDDCTSSSTVNTIDDVGPTRALTINIPPSNPDASAVDHYGINSRDLAQV
jgi:hypothetical protein